MCRVKHLWVENGYLIKLSVNLIKRKHRALKSSPNLQPLKLYFCVEEVFSLSLAYAIKNNRLRHQGIQANAGFAQADTAGAA